MKQFRVSALAGGLLLAAALCGCASVSQGAGGSAETAPEITATTLPGTEEELTNPPAPMEEVPAEQELTNPPAPEEAVIPGAETIPETAAPGDNNGEYAWFRRGVYDTGAGVYYLFYDEHTGMILNAEGLGTPFTCEQTRGYIAFHMGSAEDTDVMYITVDDALHPVGTWDGETTAYTFTDLEQDPDRFVLPE